MKRETTIILLMLFTIGCWAQKVWKDPEFKPNEYVGALNITEVELNKKETIVRFHIEQDSKRWIRFASTTILKTADGKTYAITGGRATREGETNLIPDSLFYTPEGINEADFALHFEPLPSKANSFDLIEGYGNRDFQFFNISNPADIIEANWRDVNTGDWIVGFFKDYAIYDSKIWQYNTKTDNKIVLCNGNNNTTIAIGKYKDGERVFNINGKKHTLTIIKNFKIPDYPTCDTTPLSTELKSGTAHISGMFTDIPNNALKNGPLSLEVRYAKNFWNENYSRIQLTPDSLGRFSIDIPLSGTQSVRLNTMTGKDRYTGHDCVLQPDDSIFVLKTLWGGMFMGKKARLQNEINNANSVNWAEYELPTKFKKYEDAIKYKDECMETYNQYLKSMKEYYAQHPTCSQQFREYASLSNKAEVAYWIWMSMYMTPSKTFPAECAECVNKLFDINSQCPLNLTFRIPNSIRSQYIYKIYNGPMKEYFLGNPAELQKVVTSGLFTLSAEDSTKIALWRSNPKDVSNAEIEKIMENNGILGGLTQSKFYKMDYPQSIISILPNDTIRDLCISHRMNQRFVSHMPLDNDLLKLVDNIKNESIKENILKQHNYYTEAFKANEKVVKGVIHPSSDVEGLTDGKAILDKLVEPYKGKIVYLDIWGTWCSPCIAKLKESHKLKAELKDYDIVYLYLANKSQEGSWKNIIGEYNLTDPNCVHYRLPDGQQKAIEKYVGLTQYPTYRLIDKNGGLHHLEPRDDEDIPKFKKMLDEINR